MFQRGIAQMDMVLVAYSTTSSVRPAAAHPHSGGLSGRVYTMNNGPARNGIRPAMDFATIKRRLGFSPWAALCACALRQQLADAARSTFAARFAKLGPHRCSDPCRGPQTRELESSPLSGEDIHQPIQYDLRDLDFKSAVVVRRAL